MVKYLVAEYSVATEKNESRKGTVSVCYHGRGGRILAIVTPEQVGHNFLLWTSDIAEYGYNRESDAKKCFAYRYPENSEFWRSTSVIVEFNI